MAERPNGAAVLISIALWLGGVLAGFGCLWTYTLRPGGAAQAPAEATSEIRSWQRSGRPLLVMALHPHCPCSRASVDELADLLGWTLDASDLVLLIYKPAGEPDSWLAPSQYASLARFHPRIVVDADGSVASSLGARTSGHVIAYDEHGHLAYSGGVTPGRGHHGPSAGQDALRDLLHGRRGPVATAPTFGCPLQECTTAGAP